MDKENRNSYNIEEVGQVQIADEVIAVIAGLAATEVDGVANLPMQIFGVEIGITCKQQQDGSYRISLRAGDHADVSKVANRFGGGGHVKASGCSVSEGDPETVCKMLMDVSAEVWQGEKAEQA